MGFLGFLGPWGCLVSIGGCWEAVQTWGRWLQHTIVMFVPRPWGEDLSTRVPPTHCLFRS
jgi:hypothetical protein